jgi:hypothetical protein
MTANPEPNSELDKQLGSDATGPSARQQGASSVRVAIVGFAFTLLVLTGMGVYWLLVRV